MNALTLIAESPAADAWDEATERVNAWRGQALHRYAEAEWAVSEALIALRVASPDKKPIKLRRLVGQRFEDLRCAVGPDGPFAKDGAKAAAALAAFAPHEALRPFLCHGTAKVTLDRHKRWLVVLRVLAFSNKTAARESCALSENDAKAVLTELTAASRALRSELQSLRDRIAKGL
jgi:hypothetical protein